MNKKQAIKAAAAKLARAPGDIEATRKKLRREFDGLGRMWQSQLGDDSSIFKYDIEDDDDRLILSIYDSNDEPAYAPSIDLTWDIYSPDTVEFTYHQPRSSASGPEVPTTKANARTLFQVATKWLKGRRPKSELMGKLYTGRLASACKSAQFGPDVDPRVVSLARRMVEKATVKLRADGQGGLKKLYSDTMMQGFYFQWEGTERDADRWERMAPRLLNTLILPLGGDLSVFWGRDGTVRTRVTFFKKKRASVGLYDALQKLATDKPEMRAALVPLLRKHAAKVKVQLRALPGVLGVS